jgi:hypothetical protein
MSQVRRFLFQTRDIIRLQLNKNLFYFPLILNIFIDYSMFFRRKSWCLTINLDNGKILILSVHNAVGPLPLYSFHSSISSNPIIMYINK